MYLSPSLPYPAGSESWRRTGKGGLAGALLSSTYQQLCAEGYQPVVDAIDLLLRACRETREIRTDVDAEDLLLLLGFLWRLEPDEAGRARSDRLLDIVMDALHASPNGK